jgi:hypothetical protein
MGTHLDLAHLLTEEHGSGPGYCTLNLRLRPALLAWEIRDPFGEVLVLRKQGEEVFVYCDRFV